jgi:hypothetical protein|tara:strand:- start:198 stop:767 length:570 start_codon:yes stop_codon:yes gene_type:complete
MVKLAEFKDKRTDVLNFFIKKREELNSQIKKECNIEIVEKLSDEVLNRMIELEQEIYGIKEIEFQKNEMIEYFNKKDSIVIILIIDQKIEGYAFGYAEEIVKGTEYYGEDIIISLKYQQKRIGEKLHLCYLYAIFCLGYRTFGFTTAHIDKAGRELVKWYKSQGCEDAESATKIGHPMRIRLSEEYFEQ